MTVVHSNPNHSDQSVAIILLVEEDRDAILTYSTQIQKIAPCRIETMNPNEDLLERIKKSQYDLIILNESKSIRIDQIKKATPTTRIIVVSTDATVEKAVEAIRLGAEDYLRKPIAPEVLERALVRGLKKEFERYPDFQQLIYVDDATGLYNFRYLNFVLEREIARRDSLHRSFAVLFIDADDFKSVNNVYGHSIGTKLLNELGNHLKKYVREKDTVFRYGGDEFVAVLAPCDLPTAKVVAERIRESVETTAFLEEENLKIHFTISIGVAIFPDHARTKREIIEAADRAMFEAKSANRNSVFVTKARVSEGIGRKTS